MTVIPGQSEYVSADTIDQALEECPWASYWAPVEGGFAMFAYEPDYLVFINQR